MGSMGEPEVGYTDVLVIGAGFGAFTVLNRVRRQGYDVTIFEKGTAAGGSKRRRKWKSNELDG
jgi:cation diffusion facilitator CzcD-associated flavoprotein CzcO